MVEKEISLKQSTNLFSAFRWQNFCFGLLQSRFIISMNGSGIQFTHHILYINMPLGIFFSGLDILYVKNL